MRVACAFVRVSTEELAKHKLSIDGQVPTPQNRCRKDDTRLVDAYIEPGLSGADENRPEFNWITRGRVTCPAIIDEAAFMAAAATRASRRRHLAW